MKHKINLFLVSTVVLILSLLHINISYSQLIYNSSYDCFILLSVKNFTTCNIYLHEYSFGKPKTVSNLYAELKFENGYLDLYQKHYIDLNYEDSRQFNDLYLKSNFVDSKLSVIKMYNSDGNLNRKFAFTYKNDNTIDVKCTDNYGEGYTFNNSLKHDPSGLFSVSFIQKENHGYQEFKYKKKDTLSTSYYYYIVDNHTDQGDIDSYEQFMYGADLNIRNYKKLVELYSDEGSKRQFSVLDKFYLKYTFDDYKNPSEVILYGQSGEPEFLLEFKYNN